MSNSEGLHYSPDRVNARHGARRKSVHLTYARSIPSETVLLCFVDPQGSDEWWARFDACDRSIGRFLQTMPPVNLARNVEELASLVLVHSTSNQPRNGTLDPQSVNHSCDLLRNSPATPRSSRNRDCHRRSR